MRHYPGDDIGVFLAVCDSGNFTAAANLLGLTPSAVTKAIQRLENRLKTPLFTRTTRQQTITAEGVIYRDACRAARLEVDRVEMLLASITAEPAGQLAVSVPPLLGAQVITPALLALCQQWPQLSISISASVEMADLFDGSVDLAVRVGELPDAAGIVAKRLGTQRIVLCGTPGYFAQSPPLHGIDDLQRHTLIGTLKEGYAAPWHFQLADKTHRVMTPDTRLLLDGALLTVNAIKEGYGLGRVPYWLVKEELERGLLVSVLDEVITGHLPIHALWRATPVMLPRLRLAIDALIAATAAQF
ncbi:LysR family transcriptional regulator [Symbiopectobacterium purcellii]|uniref:LysR family transcriptional regulator n=1 Tax=Symbiopectobacterium purcellii TaxID=2871826 RepID=A0ABX9AIM8_9ENTR|nr:LysR family transcriptional regulator [Symbiopectobacterium purcellii]QZN95029.1 LysR family transcriptional regulator [Symbiopectobacterium purcellii]